MDGYMAVGNMLWAESGLISPPERDKISGTSRHSQWTISATSSDMPYDHYLI